MQQLNSALAMVNGVPMGTNGFHSNGDDPGKKVVKEEDYNQADGSNRQGVSNHNNQHMNGNSMQQMQQIGGLMAGWSADAGAYGSYNMQSTYKT